MVHSQRRTTIRLLENYNDPEKLPSQLYKEAEIAHERQINSQLFSNHSSSNSRLTQSTSSIVLGSTKLSNGDRYGHEACYRYWNITPQFTELIVDPFRRDCFEHSWIARDPMCHSTV